MSHTLFDRWIPVFAPLAASWQCDLSDDRLAWAPGVYDIFGIPRDRRLDRRAILRMYEAESRERLEALRARAIAEGGSFTFEAQIVRADGDHRWMRISADVERRAGRAVRLYGIKQDVTHEFER